MTTNALSIPRSVEWTGESIRLLNQQKLPSITEFLTLSSIDDVYEAIKTLKVRGAPAIGIAAAYGLALAGSQYETEELEPFLTKLKQDRDYLSYARPTAVNLFWALDRIIQVAENASSVNEAKTAIIHEAIQIQVEDEEVCRLIGENALSLFKDGDRVLTHCNAGSIATARYGTALAPFYIGKERGVDLHVYACETRPVLQGARLTTWELMQAGIDVTLITDSMAAHTIQTKKISAIIVGADRIAANGDTANKIGTLNLAILAKEYDIPFFVAAPLSTFDLSIESGKDIPIEERNLEEITTIQGIQIAPDEVKVFNPAFDVTPHSYISGIITEKGLITGSYEEEIRALFKEGGV